MQSWKEAAVPKGSLTLGATYGTMARSLEGSTAWLAWIEHCLHWHLLATLSWASTASTAAHAGGDPWSIARF